MIFLILLQGPSSGMYLQTGSSVQFNYSDTVPNRNQQFLQLFDHILITLFTIAVDLVTLDLGGLLEGYLNANSSYLLPRQALFCTFASKIKPLFIFNGEV